VKLIQAGLVLVIAFAIAALGAYPADRSESLSVIVVAGTVLGILRYLGQK
jgi:hypothetical protein